MLSTVYLAHWSFVTLVMCASSSFRAPLSRLISFSLLISLAESASCEVVDKHFRPLKALQHRNERYSLDKRYISNWHR